MSMGTIFIQPHSDDMVMSSYFLIKTEVFPQPYYLLTIFGQSNWVDPIKRKLPMYRMIKDKTSITQLRKREDSEFASLCGFKLLFFNLEDCLLRNGRVFYHPDKKLDENLIKKTREIIVNSVKKLKANNVVLPFPCGKKQHYDHRIIKEAAMGLPLKLCTKYFVDDFPYSRINRSQKYNLFLFKKVKVKDLKEKLCAMKIYDSQMCSFYKNQIIKLTKQNKGYERVFKLVQS